MIGYSKLFTLAYFSMKTIVMDPFTRKKTVRITFLTDSCIQNAFVSGDSVCVHSIDSGSSWCTYFWPIYKQYLTRTSPDTNR